MSKLFFSEDVKKKIKKNKCICCYVEENIYNSKNVFKVEEEKIKW